MVSGFLSPVHVALLLAVAVLLFGAKRLPELGSSLGKGMRDFKDSLEGRNTHAEATSVDANAPNGAPAAALQSAQPVVVRPSVAQPVMSGQAADETPPSPPIG